MRSRSRTLEGFLISGHSARPRMPVLFLALRSLNNLTSLRLTSMVILTEALGNLRVVQLLLDHTNVLIRER
jgi:hypothetical protein